MMDFLDPKKSRAHTRRLYIGYILVAIALGLATTILLYLANGFNVQQGKVIQNGLVFVSSNPGGASIFLNDKEQDSQTNTRLVLPAGTYTMRLAREGYREWQRALTVEGGSVDRFDYPLLIPNDLATATAGEYASAPPLTTQSPDRRWLMVQQPGSVANFDVYDTEDPEKIKTAKKVAVLPASVPALPLSDASQLEVVEWSNDNSHVLLRHSVAEQSEYIMLSRDKPEESVNVSRELQLAPTATLSLQDKKYDKYFVHDATAQTLSTADLESDRVVPLLTSVIDYKTYGSDVILYATADGASEGKVSIKLYQDEKSYAVRQVTQGSSYLLDISRYSDSWYVVAGSAAENHVYIYQDPADRLRQDVTRALVPVEVLKLDKPNYVEFSANSRFVMAQNNQNFAVFDAENERSHTYRLDKPMDQPQEHATWLDGYHLRLVSNGSAMIFDYDGTNVQTLTATSSSYVPMFDTAYQTLYTLAPETATTASPVGRSLLTATPLRTVADQ